MFYLQVVRRTSIKLANSAVQFSHPSVGNKLTRDYLGPLKKKLIRKQGATLMASERITHGCLIPVIVVAIAE